MNRYQNSDVIDLLAAEYVLGTLKGRARRRFEKLQHEHPKIRAEVQAWQLRLNNLAANSVAVEPPTDLWHALEQRLFTAEIESAPALARWYEKLVFWRALTVGSGLIAAVLALLLVLNPLQNPSASYVVVLNNGAQQPVWSVSSTHAMDQIYVQNLQPMQMGANQGCMLWVQQQGTQKMHALGFLPDDGSKASVSVDEKLRAWLAEGKLMVTVEQKSQALPTLPSGQIEFSGQFVPLTRI